MVILLVNKFPPFVEPEG